MVPSPTTNILKRDPEEDADAPGRGHLRRRRRSECRATRQRQEGPSPAASRGNGPCDTWLSDVWPQGPESRPRGLWLWVTAAPGLWSRLSVVLEGCLGSPGSCFWNAPGRWGCGCRRRAEESPGPPFPDPQHAPVRGIFVAGTGAPQVLLLWGLGSAPLSASQGGGEPRASSPQPGPEHPPSAREPGNPPERRAPWRHLLSGFAGPQPAVPGGRGWTPAGR